MVATPPAESLEDSSGASEQDDAAWLVRQFGRFAPLLKEACPRPGGSVPSAADFGFLVGAKVIAAQEHIQSRRLLQLSNRQHQEHLQNLQQLSAAHAQRLQNRARRQKRKRARGCEHNAESSSSSSSEDEAAEGTNAAGGPRADRDAAGRCKEQGGGPPLQPVIEGPPTAAPTEEAAALLLSAYDLITCTPGTASAAPASLPASLLTFLASQEQRMKNSSADSRRKAEASEAAKPGAASKTGRALRFAGSSTDGFEGNENESRSEEENLDPFMEFAEIDAAAETVGRAVEVSAFEWLEHPCCGMWKQKSSSARIRISRSEVSDDLISLTILSHRHLNLLLQVRYYFGDGFCCIMNAYQREFKLQQALQAIVQVVRTHLVSHSKLTAAASAVIKSTQAANGANASCVRLVKVRLICSADHIQHALLVDAAELRDFRFVFETAHTRRDYREEVLSRWGSMCGFVPGWLWSGSRMQPGPTGGSSVNFAVVLRGLTTNHKRLLRSIAELQLAQLERNESPIVSLADLGTETSGVSLSLSKLKLKELLIEVTSHGAAVHAKKNGQEAVAIRANK
ncbi:hypothetical protein ACSSS7_005086 [Eimeria intestinalis]